MTKEQKDIVNERIRIANDRRRAEKRYDATKSRLNDEEVVLQRRCKHDGASNYYPDAAGGSDSWSECCLCGGDLDKNWVNEDRYRMAHEMRP